MEKAAKYEASKDVDIDLHAETRKESPSCCVLYTFIDSKFAVSAEYCLYVK